MEQKWSAFYTCTLTQKTVFVCQSWKMPRASKKCIVKPLKWIPFVTTATRCFFPWYGFEHPKSALMNSTAILAFFARTQTFFPPLCVSRWPFLLEQIFFVECIWQVLSKTNSNKWFMVQKPLPALRCFEENDFVPSIRRRIRTSPPSCNLYVLFPDTD